MYNPPKGCATAWNKPCSAKECLYPYCKDLNTDKKTARKKLLEERKTALKSFHNIKERNEK